jgi:integrase
VGLEGCHFHDLRHAAATAAVQSGATLKDTMARLGHASARAALIYQHTVRERDESIAKALNRAAAQAQRTASATLTKPRPKPGRKPKAR